MSPARKSQLTLYSQGYVAKVFRIGRLKDRLAVRWNAFAYRINEKFDRKIGEHGVKSGRVLPANVLDLSIPLRFFIQHMDKEAAGGEPGHARPYSPPASKPAASRDG